MSSNSSTLPSSSFTPSSSTPATSVTLIPFTLDIVRFRPYQFPLISFQYASSSTGEPPYPEVVYVNGHNTHSVYNLKKSRSLVISGDQDIVETLQVPLCPSLFSLLLFTLLHTAPLVLLAAQSSIL
ncbi:hypothetical protein HMI56_003215, partial [Coelomomyces lativittatus]